MPLFDISSPIPITIDTGKDLATATLVEIRYRAPGNVRGSFTATAGLNDVTGVLSLVTYTIPPGVVSPGLWEFWAYVVTPTWTDRGETLTIEITDSNR